MKPNAPEKIYCVATEGGYYITTNKPEPPCAEGIEYTRTDAFVEKAYEYLKSNCQRFILTAKDINDFKEYMNGE